jgi:hypothetical protein
MYFFAQFTFQINRAPVLRPILRSSEYENISHIEETECTSFAQKSYFSLDSTTHMAKHKYTVLSRSLSFATLKQSAVN